MLKDNFTITKTKETMKNRNPFITLILLFLAMMVPMIIIGMIGGFFIVSKYPSMANNPQAIAEYFKNLDSEYQILGNLYMTIIVALSAYIFAKYFQKRDRASLGLTNPNKGKNYIKGLALGLGMICLVVLILKIMGLIEINANIKNISPIFFILIIIGWIFQGFEEELVTRSILMNYFASKYNVLAGIIINSLIFSLLHLGNNAFSPLAAINIFLVGILFSLLFYISDDIFLSAAAHSFWNFAQGNIFGISVSGTPLSSNTIFKSNLLANDLWTGGQFGIEAGLACTIVLILVNIYLVKKTRDMNIEK